MQDWALWVTPVIARSGDRSTEPVGFAEKVASRIAASYTMSQA